MSAVCEGEPRNIVPGFLKNLQLVPCWMMEVPNDDDDATRTLNGGKEGPAPVTTQKLAQEGNANVEDTPIGRRKLPSYSDHRLSLSDSKK